VPTKLKATSPLLERRATILVANFKRESSCNSPILSHSYRSIICKSASGKFKYARLFVCYKRTSPKPNTTTIVRTVGVEIRKWCRLWFPILPRPRAYLIRPWPRPNTIAKLQGPSFVSRHQASSSTHGCLFVTNALHRSPTILLVRTVGVEIRKWCRLWFPI
jgi:hypothetical protein